MKKIRSYILLNSLIVILCVIMFSYSGLLSMLSSVLLISCVGVITNKYHYIYVLISSLLALIAGTLFSGVGNMLILGIPVVLTGISLGISQNLKLDTKKTLIITTLIYLIAIVAKLYFVKNNLSLSDTIMTYYNEFKTAVNGMSSELSDFNMLKLNESLDLAMKAVISIVPALITVSCMSVCFIALMLFKKILKSFDDNSDNLAHFSMLNIERINSIIFITLAFATLILPEGVFLDVINNVLIILGSIFFVIGLSSVDCFMLNKNISKFIRIILCVILLPFLSFVLLLPGIIILGLGLMRSLAIGRITDEQQIGK